VLFEAPPAAAPSAADRVIPERNAFLVTSLLGDVTRRGTAARAQATLRRPDLYGKTGTTDDAVDAWFAGFHPTAVGVAWIGYDTPRSLGDRESGGGLALPVWIDAMRPSLRNTPVLPAQAPQDGLVAAGGDWRYAEWADGGHHVRIGASVPSPPAASFSAASEPGR
jgi:penicillin-binding protein 1A